MLRIHTIIFNTEAQGTQKHRRWFFYHEGHEEAVRAYCIALWFLEGYSNLKISGDLRSFSA